MQRFGIPKVRKTHPIRDLFAFQAGHVRWLVSPSIPKSQDQQPNADRDSTKKETNDVSTQHQKNPTVAEKDEELRLKMSGLSGDGGSAGIEYEDGKPVALKRSVKNNMFRYI
ncbi:hypothetical protein F4810DRAFT_659114 [Camillea tinctor]|nr:hypothetical protein F4810DRAFT_659114 [Camillea tinctor]